MTELKNDLSKQLKQVGILTTIPVVLFLGPVIGYFFGSWIDRKFLIYPWVTIISTVLGFLASGREVMRLLKEVLESDKPVKDTRDNK